MNKPNNYENTQASREYIPIELGGHKLIIKLVEEMASRTGKDMLKISFDFAQGDSQSGYFEKAFRDDIRPEKKWPAAGTTYILTEDAEGNCSRQFKTFVTSVEKSNKGFQISWGDKFTQCLKNKLVGGVFGIVEEEYNDKVHANRKLRWFRSIEGVEDAAVPEDKLLSGAVARNVGAPDKDGFVNVSDGIDGELPF